MPSITSGIRLADVDTTIREVEDICKGACGVALRKKLCKSPYVRAGLDDTFVVFSDVSLHQVLSLMSIFELQSREPKGNTFMYAIHLPFQLLL